MNKFICFLLCTIVFFVGVGAAEDNTTDNVVPDSDDSQNIEELKFRIGPSIKLRPVNDVIESGEDGLIEMYMDNPSINDVDLNVDVKISAPSGIHVNGEGFGQATAAGTVNGQFSIPPGGVKTIYVNVKSEKVGTFTLHLSGFYYPGNNKDDYKPISFTHPFTVTEKSKNMKFEDNPKESNIEDNKENQEPDESDNNEEDKEYNFDFNFAPGFGSLFSICILGLIGFIFARKEN